MIHKIHNLKQIDTLSLTPPTPDGINVIEELIAEDGKMLTQNAHIPLQERILAYAVMLGRGCPADDWIEITQEDADIIKQQQEEERERENALGDSNALATDDTNPLTPNDSNPL